ncbi:MAG: hypothetical protein ACR2N7_02790 [Acidimicrobiia bacterium]
MLLRVLLVVAVIAAGFLVVAVGERWRSRSSSLLPNGLTLISAPDCRECAIAEHQLTEVGAEYTKISRTEAVGLGVDIFTVPTAIVRDEDGNLVMVRRGKSVASDAALLVAAAS